MILEGTFQGLYPVLPHGYLRNLTILSENGEQSMHVGFIKAEQQTRQLKIGDHIIIDFMDYDHFTIKKVG